MTLTFADLRLLRDTSTSPSSSLARDLYEDKRGAVMLTGLFMSCFLIGSLWFVMGIGDTVVFRDKMQEATDHGAFSSAALHAKGMNFIALCNLIMVVGTVIHIVLGIVSDLAAAIYFACIATIKCIPKAPKLFKAWKAAYRVWDGYFTGMTKAFKALHIAQKTASYAYPAMGVVEAYQVGSKYGGDSRTGPVRVVALSTSIVPGAAIRGLGNQIGGRTQTAANSHKKEGLPVEAKKFEFLCKKVVTVASTGVVNLLGLGKSIGGNVGGRALRIFNSIIGTVLEWRYCNKDHDHSAPAWWGPPPFFSGSGGGWDRFWGEDGPYVVFGAASNGSMWMQTWAINASPKLYDNSHSRVGVAGGPKNFLGKATRTESPGAYFAQSEFYFDCDSKWSDAACNFEDNALFAIKWRARLRRLELPALTSGIAGVALESLGNLPAVEALKNALPGKIGDVLGTSGLSQTVLKGVIDGVVAQVEEFIKDTVGQGAGNLDPSAAGFGIGVYH